MISNLFAGSLLAVGWLLWLALMVAAGIMASRKNRRALSWVLLVLVCGPSALLVLYFLPPLSPLVETALDGQNGDYLPWGGR